MHTLQGINALLGLSTVSSMVAIIRYRVARRRSDMFSASLAKASVAFSRASLNRSLALERSWLVESSKPLRSNFVISSVSKRASLLAACAISALYSRWILALSKN